MKRTFWQKVGSAIKTILILLMALTILGSGLLVWLSLDMIREEPNPNNPLALLMDYYFPEPTVPPTEQPTEPPTEPETEPPTTEPPEPEHVVARATIGATGDMLMHLPVIDSVKQEDGSYNFDPIFQYLKPYSEAEDYAVANLETTLGGLETGYAYSGYPKFNCPDDIAGSLKRTGFDMLLTANNHSYDTGEAGYYRTVQVVRKNGMTALGTMLNGEEPRFVIQNLNGIKIGMMCYTYEGRPDGARADRVYLNGLMMHAGAEQVINSFNPANPTPFYNEVSGYIDRMRALGAEAIVMFMHWGVEYTTSPVSSQTQIAQALCNLGVDVIVGGHAHMVEPISLLTSTTNPDHKTVCLYSMGNTLSNQLATVMKSYPSGHTEDGVWFRITFSKYSDDTVYLEDVDLIPTWLHYRGYPNMEYRVLPLDASQSDEWKTLYSLDDNSLNAANRSYKRTMDIVGPGLEASRQYLAQQKEERELAYWVALMAMLDAA